MFYFNRFAHLIINNQDDNEHTMAGKENKNLLALKSGRGWGEKYYSFSKLTALEIIIKAGFKARGMNCKISLALLSVTSTD